MRRLPRVALAAVLALLASRPALAAAPTFFAAGAIAANAGADITVILPSHDTDDILVLMCWVRDTNDTMTVSGWTAVAGTPFDRGATSRYWVFWKRAASSAETNPVCDKDTITGNHYGMAVSYRGAITTGDPIDVVNATNTGTGDPASLSSVTTSVDDTLVIAVIGGEDDNNTGVTVTATDPASLTSHYTSSAVGADGAIAFAEGSRATAGITGTVSVDWDVAAPVGWGGLVLALKPPPATAGQGWWGTRWE